MPRPRKPWTKTIEEAGVTVYLFERAAGSAIYRLVREPGTLPDRKSLGHRDRTLAEQQARTLARRIAGLRFAGVSGVVTFGQLAALYERERLPLLTAARQRNVRGMLRLLERHFGREYELDNLSQHEVDGYVRARQSGKLKSPRHRTPHPGVGAGTVRNELHLLEAMARWGQSFKIAGRRLLTVDPMAGIVIPSEERQAPHREPGALRGALRRRRPS